MKKICILSAVNIKHMSMISLYTQKLKRDGIDFDIIYMDKYGEEEAFSAKRKYVFKNLINHDDSKIKKAVQYFKFRKFAIPILEKNKYDFIIVWNDIAIFMFADYLSRKWKNKYCLNVRDYNGEDNPIVYMLFKRVIYNSAFTTISSEVFKEFLPPFDYLHVHSLNSEVLSELEPRTSFQSSGEPIRISFIGNIRFFEMNKKLLDIFKNDARFKLQFFGTNANILESYATENNINNVAFHDAFQISKTAEFIKDTDLVNNLYGSGSLALDYAVSIKLYYGIYNRTPILVTEDTYMAEIIERYKIGCVVKVIDNDLPEKLFSWYKETEFSVFNANCEKLLKTIHESNKKFESLYADYCK